MTTGTRESRHGASGGHRFERHRGAAGRADHEPGREHDPRHLGAFPWIRSSITCAAVRPIRSRGWATVVSGTDRAPASGSSSKPVTAVVARFAERPSRFEHLEREVVVQGERCGRVGAS